MRSDCILQGMGQKLATTVRVQHWQKKYFKLYSNRLEWADGYMVSTYKYNCLQTQCLFNYVINVLILDHLNVKYCIIRLKKLIFKVCIHGRFTGQTIFICKKRYVNYFDLNLLYANVTLNIFIYFKL